MPQNKWGAAGGEKALFYLKCLETNGENIDSK
jgi:hypothetical protein